MHVENLSGLVIGRYALRELLGVSAMSAVYVGYQTDLERHVAIKVLSESLATDPDYSRRFTLEARTIAALEHPHIVPIYDYGFADSISFVVMRLLSGGTLAQRLDQRWIDGGFLPSLKEIADLLRQLASALDYAHRRGVIHRDVKGSNVMFDSHGVAYLVDFGIARLTYGSTALTTKGIIVGTPTHMAPEQWRDENITPSTDQYALGVMTYAMLTGTLPFNASSPHATMYKHLNEYATPPHTLRTSSPEAVTLVLEKAMAKNPEERYPTVTEFADAFTDAIRGHEGESTRFFTFSLLPETVPMQPVSPGEENHVVLPHPNSLPSVTPTPSSQHLSTPERLRQPKRTVRPRETNAKPLLVGAGLGILLLVVFVIFALAAAWIIWSRLNDESSGLVSVLNATLTSQVEVIPTLTPVTELSIPTPAITVVANADSSLEPTISTSNASHIVELAVLQQDVTPVRSIAFSPDGSILATGNGDNSVRLWNVRSGAQQAALQGHTGVIYDLAFSPDGALLASASGDRTIRLWDGRSGTYLNSLQGHEGAVRSVSFSPDGRLLASAGEDGMVRLWNVETGTQQAEFLGHHDRVLTVAFSSDGATLASGGQDSTILLWDVASGTQRTALVGHSGEIRVLTFSPDDTLLASASADTTVRVWDVAAGITLQVLRGHTSEVFSVTFSPDGSLLATGGRDNSIRLWSPVSGEQQTVLAGHQGWVFDVTFDLAGDLLASASGDGTVRVWGADS